MSTAATSLDDHHDHKPNFFVRWFFSTNHKDIGTLYFIYSIVAGVIGGALSVIMRMELADPGMQVVTDGQMWNVIISCLLYTSPSPRDGLLSRMPSSA